MIYQKLLLLLLTITNNHFFQSIRLSKSSNSRGHREYDNYKLLDAEEIYNSMHTLSKTYPSLVKLKTAQEMYKLPTIGTYDDCPFDTYYDSSIGAYYKDEMNISHHYAYGSSNGRSTSSSSSSVTPGCNMWILTIEDKIAHPVGSDSHKSLPEIFISGAIHGTERVGPTAVIEAASILLESAYCEALPMSINEPNDDDTKEKWTEWERELIESRNCRRPLHRKYGINENHRKWLARLVTTRRIVMVPTVNSLGFFRISDRENGMSVKSDFPFDLPTNKNINNNGNCMRTIAARTINELFRTHMFQISLSFHSGKVFTGYPYGSLSNMGKIPPDNVCMQDISEAISVYGGGFRWSTIDRYPTGEINQMIGPNYGRFEDWSYAASWFNKSDTSITSPNNVCNPKTYGGYSSSKTTYDDSMLRSMSFLIETSINDNPPRIHLGNNKYILESQDNEINNGHIPRNVRAIISSIDIVQPYAIIQYINHLQIQQDVVPLTTRIDRDCMENKIVSVPEGLDRVTIHFEVGGVITVDDASIWHAKWNDLPPGFNGNIQPSTTDVSKFYSIKNQGVSNVQIAPSTLSVFEKEYDDHEEHQEWYNSHADSTQRTKNDYDSNNESGTTIYKSTINLSKYKINDSIAIFAVIEADESWMSSSTSSKMKKPQSHLVNARTNPSWSYVNKYTNKQIKGRRQFFSIPLTIKISNKQSTIKEQSVRMKYYNSHHTKKLIQEIERESLDLFGIILDLFGIILAVAFILKGFYYYSKNRNKDNFHNNYPMDVARDEIYLLHKK